MKAKSKSRNNYRCNNCSALCCRDLAMLITKPKTRSDISELEWYVRFDTVNIFVRSHRWYLLIKGKCVYLNRNNLCKIYDKRPPRCRKHQPPDCERFGEYYDVIISNPEELENYLEGRKIKS